MSKRIQESADLEDQIPSDISSNSEQEMSLSNEEQMGSDAGSDVGSDAGSDSAGETETPQPKKHRKDEKFGEAMSAILGSKIKAYNSENPILIRNTKPARDLEQEKQNRKARKALRAERLQNKDKARVKDIIPKDTELAGDKLQHEKKLRKVAQKGVVRLLNAIHHAQSSISQELPSSEKQATEMATEVSKEKFLDMIRMG